MVSEFLSAECHLQIQFNRVNPVASFTYCDNFFLTVF